MALQNLATYLVVPPDQFDRLFAAAASRVAEKYRVGLESFLECNQVDLKREIDAALANVNTVRAAIMQQGGTSALLDAYKQVLAEWERAIDKAVVLFETSARPGIVGAVF